MLTMSLLLALELLAASTQAFSTARHPFDGSRCSVDNDSFDYIVVGGGTAGTALATRLSQRLDDCILLIEAGPTALDEPKINIPGLKGSAIGTKYDWNPTTVPQPHVANRLFSQPRGHVLGGSSALNLVVWDRAAKADYDSWEELGNPGWNWDSMIDAMLKVENFTGINTTDYGSVGVAEGGPIDTAIFPIVPGQQKFWIPTLERLGLPQNLESLGGNPLGVMLQPANVNSSDWTRSYPPNAYLPHARSNLIVMTTTRTELINFAKHGNNQLTACGVTVEGNITISAHKEVILSAGSLQSPGLLEVSGIGQKSVLELAGVEPILDLPGVGENLQDHLRVQTSYQLRSNYSPAVDRLRYDAAYAAEQLALWKEGAPSEYDSPRSGYSFMTWAQADVVNATQSLIHLAEEGLANSTSPVDQRKLRYLTDPNLSAKVAQLEFIFADGYAGVKGYPANTSDLYGQNFFTIYSAVQHTLSRGSVHINSSSLADKPIIDPHYLEQPYDLAALVAALQMIRKIATSYPLRQAWVDEYEPGLQVQTEQQWKEYAINNTLTIYHPMGTCAMLPRKDGGVVDPSLKVYGTTNLRVVDASIMPILISGHLQTAVLGIAEKAADIIVRDRAHR